MIIAYIRPDGAEMVEVAPGEAVNAAYLKAEGLDAEPRRPLTEIKAEAEQAIAVSHAQAVAKAEKKQTEAPPPRPLYPWPLSGQSAFTNPPAERPRGLPENSASTSTASRRS